MLFQNASDRHRIKNKWNNQRIHKKYNKIQYASKHYWLDNDIIFKRKNPVKQRKDRKKFKTQRARKKVYKRMSFDFDDFIYRNKTPTTTDLPVDRFSRVAPFCHAQFARARLSRGGLGSDGRAVRDQE